MVQQLRIWAERNNPTSTPTSMKLLTYCVLPSVMVMSVALVGCSSFGTNRYQLDQRTDSAITKYYYAMESHQATSFSAFVSKLHVSRYYVYVGDRQFDPDLYLTRPQFAPGYSIQQIKQHGNRIYAIPIKTYVAEWPPTKIYYWIMFEREQKMYAIGLEEMRLSDFRQEYSEH